MTAEGSRPLEIPMREALGAGALRASARGPAERALLARLELTAFLRGAPCLHALDEGSVAPGARAWWFAHRLWGVDTGLAEAVACAADDAGTAREGRPPAWAEDLVVNGRARAVHVATLRTPGDQRDQSPERASGSSNGSGLVATSITSSLRDALPLSASYEETLAGFGRRTRRNVRLTRRAAASLGMSFAMTLGASPVPRPEIRRLAARTRPFPPSPGRIGRLERYVAATGGGFRSCLRGPEGRLISYCCGFLHARTAYLVYQLNDAEWHALSPSLLHRAHLIEALTAMGPRELIFVHGCSGLLQHACRPMSVEQTWIMRSGMSARLLARAVAAAAPATAYRRLALQALQRSVAREERLR